MPCDCNRYSNWLGLAFSFPELSPTCRRRISLGGECAQASLQLRIILRIITSVSPNPSFSLNTFTREFHRSADRENEIEINSQVSVPESASVSAISRVSLDRLSLFVVSPRVTRTRVYFFLHALCLCASTDLHLSLVRSIGRLRP